MHSLLQRSLNIPAVDFGGFGAFGGGGKSNGLETIDTIPNGHKCARCVPNFKALLERTMNQIVMGRRDHLELCYKCFKADRVQLVRNCREHANT